MSDLDSVKEILSDITLEAMIGMNKDEFMRQAQLMINPEGYPERDICPICKNKIKKEENGDMFCENYTIDEKEIKNGKCFWHRYKNGLNYWSPPSQMIPVMCKEMGISMKELKERADKKI